MQTTKAQQPTEFAEDDVAPEAAQLFAALETPPRGLDRDEHAARHTLRRQIARLERELSGLVTDDLIAGARGRVSRDGTPSVPAAAPRLLDLGALEVRRDEVLGLLREVEEHRQTEKANRALLREMYRDPGAHRHCRLETRELAERGCKIYEVVPRFGFVGILGGWWRVKVSSGCPLPTAVLHPAPFPTRTSRGGTPVASTVVNRVFDPAKSALEEVGDMMILAGKTIVSAVRPPYSYGDEFVHQFLFALRLCWFPLLVSTVAFGFGAPGLQAANFLVLFGALDRLGGFFVLASIREFAPFVTAVVLAGVAGTAITADLGARKIREELDALQVLGVDPIKSLVVPRFLALMIVTGLFDVYALIFGIFGGIVATLVNGAPLGPFWATFFGNASTTDLWGSFVKCTLFGAIIAVVCSYKGMTAKGGAEGVGRAVNQAVVIAFLGIFAFNYVFTQTLLATNPEMLVIK